MLALIRLPCVLVSLALLSACAERPTMRLRCELDMAAKLAAGQPVVLTFSLINAGNDAVQVLEWQTPFEQRLTAPIFTITRDGAEVEYRGRMVKRGAPRAEQYFQLGPGERRRATLDLARDWDITAPGHYRVEYTASLMDVVAGDASVPRGADLFVPITPTCTPIEFDLPR